MRVWLDDIRPAPPGWVWTKTVPQTIKALESGRVTDLSLDYDLDVTDPKRKGIEVLHWLEEALASGQVERMPPVHWHTANPLGSVRFTMSWRRLEQANGYPWAPSVPPVSGRRRNPDSAPALYADWSARLDAVAPVRGGRRPIDWRDLDPVMDSFEQDTGMELVGYGAGRAVYAVNDERVLKLAIGPRGQAQSLQECARWNVSKSPHLAPVFACATDGSWLVMGQAENIDHEEWDALPQREAVAAQFGIEDEDDSEENWGRYQGRFVLVDYGDPGTAGARVANPAQLRRRLTRR